MIEILRPNATGDENAIGWQVPADSFPATDHWNKVDEATPDEDSTYVYDSRAIAKRDLYNLPASSGSGTINKITVFARFYDTDSDVGYAYISIKSNSTVTDSGLKARLYPPAWDTVSQEWATNPADGEAWEWADIDALQIGIKIGSGGSTVRCTQVYVEVDYTPTIASAVIVGTKVTAARGQTATRASLVISGIVASATRNITMTIPLASVIIGVKTTASRVVGHIRTALNTIGIVATTVRAIPTFTRTSSVLVGIVVSAIVIEAVQAAIVYIGVKVIASRNITKAFASAVVVEVMITASRVTTSTRAAITYIGEVATTVIRQWSRTRTLAVIVGAISTATRIISATRVSSTQLGIVASASRVIAATRQAIVRIGIFITARLIILGLVRRVVVYCKPYRDMVVYSRPQYDMEVHS